MKRPNKLLGEWFWTDRYLGSSAALLPMEPRGLYREMLTESWRRGAKLPNDERTIMLAVRATPEEWARCWPLVKPYWRVDGDYIVNDTQLKIYADALKRAEKASAKAAHAAAGRWGDASSIASSTPPRNARASAQAMPEQCPPSPTPIDELQTSSAVAVTPAVETTGAAEKPVENGAVDTVGLIWSEFLALTKQPATRTMRPKEWAIVQRWLGLGLQVRHIVTAMRECTQGAAARTLAYFDAAMGEKAGRLRMAYVGSGRDEMSDAAWNARRNALASQARSLVSEPSS